jgi:hypothetical protein
VYNYMFPSSMLAASLEKPNPGGLFNAWNCVWWLYINLKADQGKVLKFKGHAIWNINQSFRKLHPTSVDNLFCHIQAKQVQWVL